MSRLKGWMEVVDDCGSHKYHVSSVKDGCYYFTETTLDDHKLRYNEREGRIEELLPEKKVWDVFSAYIYQVDFLRNE